MNYHNARTVLGVCWSVALLGCAHAPIVLTPEQEAQARETAQIICQVLGYEDSGPEDIRSREGRLRDVIPYDAKNFALDRKAQPWVPDVSDFETDYDRCMTVQIEINRTRLQQKIAGERVAREARFSQYMSNLPSYQPPPRIPKPKFPHAGSWQPGTSTWRPEGFKLPSK